MLDKKQTANNIVVGEDLEEGDEAWEDQPLLFEALEAAAESITRLREALDDLGQEYESVQTTLNTLLDDADDMVEGLNHEGGDGEEEDNVLDLTNLTECLDAVYALVSVFEDGNPDSQAKEVLYCIRDCYKTVKRLASSSENGSPEDGNHPQPTAPTLPNLPARRFFGRSKVLQLGVDHLCSSSALPAKVLITGENGAGKTALALQLLHHEEVQATFDQGLGCYYIDCAPFYSDREKYHAGAGVSLAKAILALLKVELQPMEKDILGFLYSRLVAKGSKATFLLVLDGLIDDATPEEKNGQALTVGKVVETVASIYCISLIIVAFKGRLRQMLSWTQVLPEDGSLGPLDLESAAEMFEELLREELIKEQEEDDDPIEMPDREDIVKLLQFQSANRLPLGITILARMQKFHNGPLETCGYLEELRHGAAENPSSTSNDGLTLIYDTLLRSIVKKTKTSRDAPRLMALLVFLPEGLPNYQKVLPRLASDEYLSFDTFDEPETSVDMLMITGLVEKRTSAEGIGALIASQSIKKYFQINPDEDPFFANDLNILLYFIDHQRSHVPTPELALAIGATNIYHLLDGYLKRNSSYDAAGLAYKCCYMLSINKSLLNEGVMENIRRVHDGLLAEAEAEKTKGGVETNLQQVDADEARRRLVDFLLDYGRVLEHLNRAEKARKVAREAIELAETLEDEIRVGAALIIEGQASQLDDRHDESYSSFQRASTIFEAYGLEEEVNLARTLHGMGYARRMKGLYEESRELEERACALCNRHGEPVFLGDALYGLGMTYKMIGRYDEALEKYEETRQLSVKNPNLTVAASTLNSMGQIYNIKEQPAKAMEKYQAAYQMFKQIQSQVGMARALDNIGEALRGMNRFDEAIEKNREAYAILKSFGDLLGMGNALDNWGLSLKSLERLEEAATKFKEAVSIFARAGLPRSRANALYHHGEVLFLLKQDFDAAAAFGESGSIFAMIGLDSSAANAKWQEAVAYEFAGSIVQAAIAFGQVYEIYEKMGYENGMNSAADKLQFLGGL